MDKKEFLGSIWKKYDEFYKLFWDIDSFEKMESFWLLNKPNRPPELWQMFLISISDILSENAKEQLKAILKIKNNI